MKCYGLTDRGLKRRSNQDFFRIHSSKRYTAAVVCDGMGGAKGGLTASRTAAVAFMKNLRSSMAGFNPDLVTTGDLERILATALTAANTAVYEKAGTSEALEGMGTTLVAFLHAAGKTVVVNTGDSRLYASKDGNLRQITKDHSFVQYLVDTGIITPAQAEHHPQKNIILKVIGVNEHAEYDIFTLSDYDNLLLCTDGLVNMVSFEELSQILTGDLNLETKVERLINLANERGGYDNITAVIFQRKDEKVSNG
ncbi:MAG: Stp1/IreP family PP2C-type Ser/Thr phosphatase [Eubacteriales bacterium]|jgi:serine/threonine protein phosphatase PrpC